MNKDGLGRITSFKSDAGQVYDLGVEIWEDKVVNIFVYTASYGNFIAATMKSVYRDGVKYTKCFPINNVQWIRYE
jgi:hypothetical protein